MWALSTYPLSKTSQSSFACHIGDSSLVMVVVPTKGDLLMTAKLNPIAAAPSLMKEWHSTSVLIASSLEPGLSELVKIRASQINGCANCLNMHTVFARENGEPEHRIYLLSAWREAPCYTDRERAALGWTDALTKLSQGHALAGERAVLHEYFQ